MNTITRSGLVRSELIRIWHSFQEYPLELEQQEEVPSRLPLSTLLSQVLVAFTIEFDNEFEHQMPHRTTNHGSTTGSRQAPWLVSLVMWSNCMQFVREEGVTVAELQRLARTVTNLAGMQRWGYIAIEPDLTDGQSKRPRPNAVIRPTRAGRKAQEIWRPLFDLIEARWQERFGRQEIKRLLEALWMVAMQFDFKLPDCLPILEYGLYSLGHHPSDDQFLEARAHAGSEDGGTLHLPLSALLSRVLLAFAMEFELESSLSLAISANLLRTLNEQGVQLRALPLLAGVSKEAISMAMGILEKGHFVVVEPDPDGSRFKIVRLTPKGRKAQETYRQLLDVIEDRWEARFGEATIYNLREALEQLVGNPTAQQSPLFKGLEPYPDGWRASVRKPETLPHYPMVLHRGGFPDGS